MRHDEQTRRVWELKAGERFTLQPGSAFEYEFVKAVSCGSNVARVYALNEDMPFTFLVIPDQFEAFTVPYVFPDAHHDEWIDS